MFIAVSPESDIARYIRFWRTMFDFGPDRYDFTRSSW